MGCVESTRKVKKIKVVQQSNKNSGGVKSSKGRSSSLYPRTPLPNLVNEDIDDELRNLQNTTDLGESYEWRPGDLVRKAGSSPDSGVFELSGPEYGSVVTEKSPPDLINKVERDFHTPESISDLVIRGHACPRRVSNIRSEEAAIIHTLRKEGILTKERAATTGGLSYELVLTEGQETTDNNGLYPGARLPPIRLRKLERRRARHRREYVSERDIYARLEKAKERRKEMEQERVRRVTERVGSAKPVEVIQLQHLAKVRKNIEKFENTIENREHYLRNLRKKLRQHHEHAAVIRLKRALGTSEDNSRCETPGTADF